jgi:hypothetical protein
LKDVMLEKYSSIITTSTLQKAKGLTWGFFIVKTLMFTLPQVMFLDWKFEWILLNTIRCQQILTLERKVELVDLYFKLWACTFKCMSMFYMMYSLFKGWHMVVTLALNKNFDVCLNSTMKISWVTTIMSPASLDFKMLQEGIALM